MQGKQLHYLSQNLIRYQGCSDFKDLIPSISNASIMCCACWTLLHVFDIAEVHVSTAEVILNCRIALAPKIYTHMEEH